ncbi:nitrogen regulation protein NR(II), partial [Hydrogenophaga sp.]|uniref:two-component system sensor histidine kinase NtrB n=1 Tax=Hydrogenophaga sp. TaxID=1904254 RepID=UPI0035640264
MSRAIPPEAVAVPSQAGRTGDHRKPRSLRWLLWSALLLLVGLLIAVLVFLADDYELGREQAALEQDAASVVSDIRSALTRNSQTLMSLHTGAISAADWAAPAAQILAQRREIVQLQWRDGPLRLLAAADSPLQLMATADSPFLADLYGYLGRDQSLLNAREACAKASRLSGPAFSASYFWPMQGGKGLELMEMCLPLGASGESKGFLIATYSLTGMLQELTTKDIIRGRGLAFVEPDGARLAVHSQIDNHRRTLRARAVLNLPGHALTLQLDGSRRAGGWFPNLLTGVVGVLALSLLGVLVLLGRDMRLRQRAEQELGDALAFRKAMENSLVTGLRARDMSGRITYVNPAFCQMLGFSAKELLGSGLPAPYWPSDQVQEYGLRQSQRLQAHLWPREGFESTFQRKDGSRLPVLIIEAPLIDAQGEQSGWMGAILDMSEQRRVEDLNRASQERLQATARLATVGEMASLLSHELNQPLAAIASYASGTLNLLQPGETPPPGELGLAMQRISEQAERAGRVVKSVTDFVRRRERSREAVAAQDLIDAIMPLLGLQAKKLDIRVTTQIADGLPMVLCDRTMVEQVLLNLARNGMQAMPEGDPTPASGQRRIELGVSQSRLSASPLAQGLSHRRWVEFAVTDHGQGLAPDVQEKLFTPFFTTRAEGMGLGLSLCRSVVEQHGGALTF